MCVNLHKCPEEKYEVRKRKHLESASIWACKWSYSEDFGSIITVNNVSLNPFGISRLPKTVIALDELYGAVYDFKLLFLLQLFRRTLWFAAKLQKCFVKGDIAQNLIQFSPVTPQNYNRHLTCTILLFDCVKEHHQSVWSGPLSSSGLW